MTTCSTFSLAFPSESDTIRSHVLSRLRRSHGRSFQLLLHILCGLFITGSETNLYILVIRATLTEDLV
jgi:hypothetical protein